MKEECLTNAKIVFTYLQRSFGSENKWCSVEEDKPQRNLEPCRGKDAVGICRKAHVNFQCYDSIARGESRANTWKTVIHNCADLETIETIFRTIVSANQLSLFGAIANICEEYESLHDRSGQPDKVMGTINCPQ